MLASLPSPLKVALSLALLQQASALSASEWRDKTIYQVVTDRFGASSCCRDAASPVGRAC